MILLKGCMTLHVYNCFTMCFACSTFCVEKLFEQFARSGKCSYYQGASSVDSDVSILYSVELLLFWPPGYTEGSSISGFWFEEPKLANSFAVLHS